MWQFLARDSLQWCGMPSTRRPSWCDPHHPALQPRHGSGAHVGHASQEVAVKVIKKEMFKGQKEELRLKAEVRAPPAHSKSILCR